MLDTDVIIVGGGPAGSACAWKLRQRGVDCVILEKAVFPRRKLCAGWIAPKVLEDLNVEAKDYPHSCVRLDRAHVHLCGFSVTIRTREYSVRRLEFDDWLLRRSGAAVHTHRVQHIAKVRDRYVIDGTYRCRYLVGAGGTACPVARQLFDAGTSRPSRDELIVALEQEFPEEHRDGECHICFEKGLAGYAWYVSKGQGIVNVGLGGYADSFRTRGVSIQEHWRRFVRRLEELSLVRGPLPAPKGYVYPVRGRDRAIRCDDVFLLGDAAGLATRDAGEGIGPAVESGVLAARAIADGGEYSMRGIKKYSLPSIARNTLRSFLPSSRRTGAGR